MSSKILGICEGVIRNFEIYHGSIPAIHHGKLKENMWTQYAGLRVDMLPLLWKYFLKTINCKVFCSKPLLMELVNESINC